MNESAASDAVRAAGALTFSIDASRTQICFEGNTAAFHLPAAALGWAGFRARLGPADQQRLAQALDEPQIDLRLRLIGEGGELNYVRLLGARDDAGSISGLMTPAGDTRHGAGRIEEEHALAEAMATREIQAWYQPIIALDTRRLAGFEALARWVRPGVGVLVPQDFLGMAEDIDLLGRISDRVRGNAVADLSAWRTAHAHAGDLFVSANATVSDLVSPGFAAAMIDRLRAAKLPEGLYKLEIAETEIMRDPDAASAVMDALAEGGIHLALDDFGTGYSSLARLDSLPFHIVKIDQYFVRAMAGNESAATVVKSVIQLARHLSMKVVAEGVETEEVAAQLSAMGCDFAQGYRFAGALSPEAAGAAVRDGLGDRFAPPRV